MLYKTQCACGATEVQLLYPKRKTLEFTQNILIVKEKCLYPTLFFLPSFLLWNNSDLRVAINRERDENEHASLK